MIRAGIHFLQGVQSGQSPQIPGSPQTNLPEPLGSLAVAMSAIL